VTIVSLNVDQWAEEQFGNCAIGDARRTRRLVHFAAQVAANPNGSTPKQTESWADCKAAYHLIDCEEVTAGAIAAPHFRRTLARTEGTWLLIGDTTETHFPGKRVRGLGPTGNGGGRGFLLHSSLMVRPDGKEIVGLAGQVIRYRKRVPREPGGAQRLRRKDRESRIWSDLLDQVGPPPAGVRFIHVFDRGGDQFELYCRMQQQKADWVVRAAQLQRWVITPQGDRLKLAKYLESLPAQGEYTLELPANNDQPARTARLEVRFGPVTMPRPQHVSDWVKESGIESISMWVVEAREIDPPKGVKAARWVLWTSLPTERFEDAWTVLEHYEKRPMIEDWHKALKSGCALEERQYETASRLEAITAVLSVVAVRLLQLKTVARDEPQRPAEQVVPLSWIVMLQRLRKRKLPQPWTVREFYREMAKLGGFLGRKSDGEPGWITLWRGFEKLHLCLRGADALQRKCG
jgi:Transposase DNA-binding/Transposase Tn5 dimerisation domain